VHHAKRNTVYRLKRNFDADTTVRYSGDEQADAVFTNREVIKEEIKDDVCQAADAAVMQIGLKDPKYLDAFDEMLIERTDTQISHNKFIVLLKNDKPIQVWTGSTNFTPGGIFGQSNVGHIVRDADVAQKYFEYWQKLSTDPKKTSAKSDPKDAGIRNWTVLQQPDLKGPPPPNSVTPVFSPRLTKAMLEWYADRLAAAKNSVFFTAAFSVAQEFLAKLVKKKRVSRGTAYQRYLLLESISGKMRTKYHQLNRCPQNRIAWGDTLRTRDGEGDEHAQFIETLTGLNDHVEYLHTKYMLIDPLSDDPVVITGSANFSEASTTKNDENMMIIRGNTRVADIFLGEFMRMFKHFHHRNRVNAMSDEEEEQSRYLVPDDSWTTPYYDDSTQQFQERCLFS
jgi:phosphatidylserine/phosphatidylglycerophosphate/cardiolipin synthase-like enzyme